MRRPQQPQTDNSDEELKAILRRQFLPPQARVLDLYCGAGVMWQLAYRDRVQLYHGVDNQKVHDNALCEVDDNRRWLRTHAIDAYNVFDLDSYGSPWALLASILRKANGVELHFFLTDGLYQRLQRWSAKSIPKDIACTNRIPKNWPIPFAHLWYRDMIATLLYTIQTKTKYSITQVFIAKRLDSKPHSVVYYYLNVRRRFDDGSGMVSGVARDRPGD